MLLAFLVFAGAAAALARAQPAPPAAPTLVDAPMATAAVAYLDGSDWIATPGGANAGAPVMAVVPGDVITDLQRAGAIGDPNYELNWLGADSAAWWRPVTLSKGFSLAAAQLAGIESGASELLVVFDGIKMASSVSVNGAALGHTTNQFLRYTFSLSQAHRASGNSLLRAGEGAGNTLAVAFDPADQTTEGRFMASSGGWDWAACESLRYIASTQAHTHALTHQPTSNRSQSLPSSSQTSGTRRRWAPAPAARSPRARSPTASGRAFTSQRSRPARSPSRTLCRTCATSATSRWRR